MGNKYKYFVMLLVVSLVVLLLSGCSSEPKTETVVITDSNEVSSADQSSRPFQVQKYIGFRIVLRIRVSCWAGRLQMLSSLRSEP